LIVSDAHLYAAYNLAYGTGSTIGPIVGGQMYDRLDQGWLAVSLFAAGLMATAAAVAVAFIGKRPLLGRLLEGLRNRAVAVSTEQAASSEDRTAAEK